MKNGIYNLVLCRHNKNDITRVFSLPDEESVIPMERLLCDTAMGEDQVVTAVSRNFFVPEECLEEFLLWNGTKPEKLKEITGRVDHTYFQKEKPKCEHFKTNVEEVKTNVEEVKKKAEEDPKAEVETEEDESSEYTAKDIFENIRMGIRVMTDTIDKLEKYTKMVDDDKDFFEDLREVNSDLFSSNVEAFFLCLKCRLRESLKEDEG